MSRPSQHVSPSPEASPKARPYGATRKEIAILNSARAEVDPENKYDLRTIWAALRANGLEPKDIAPSFVQTMPGVSPKVPQDNVPTIVGKRSQIWQDLRATRLEELQVTLAGLGPDDVARFERTGHGIRPVMDDDIDKEKLALSMSTATGNFQEEMDRKHAAVKAEQQRKANVLGTEFLQEKKRMEDCENKIEAMEKRIKDYKKDQAEYWKGRREELKRKEERRMQGKQKAEKDLEEWQDETMDSMELKMARARKTRTELSSTERVKDKIEGSNQKRREAFRQAAELEERMLQRLEEKRQEVDMRLEERRQAVEADLRARAEARQDKFDRRQIKIAADQQVFVEKTLEKHRDFMEHCMAARENRKELIKGKSKSCTELMKKAQERLKENTSKLRERRREMHDSFHEKHEKADQRREELKKLGLKGGGDVHTYAEVKVRTWGELQKLKLQEMRAQEEANTQALLFELAEWQTKHEKKGEDQEQLRRKRQQVAKDTMTFADNAREGFLKIQCEPDEKRVIEMMEALGFQMPKLQEEEQEEKEEPKQPAF